MSNESCPIVIYGGHHHGCGAKAFGYCGGGRYSISDPAALSLVIWGGGSVTLAYCCGICGVIVKPQAALGGVLGHNSRTPHRPLQTPVRLPSWGGRRLATHYGEVIPCKGMPGG